MEFLIICACLFGYFVIIPMIYERQDEKESLQNQKDLYLAQAKAEQAQAEANYNQNLANLLGNRNEKLSNQKYGFVSVKNRINFKNQSQLGGGEG